MQEALVLNFSTKILSPLSLSPNWYILPFYFQRQHNIWPKYTYLCIISFQYSLVPTTSLHNHKLPSPTVTLTPAQLCNPDQNWVYISSKKGWWKIGDSVPFLFCFFNSPTPNRYRRVFMIIHKIGFSLNLTTSNIAPLVQSFNLRGNNKNHI